MSVAEFVSLQSVRIKSERYILRAISVNELPISGLIQASAPTGSLPSDILPGDIVELHHVALKEIRGFRNIGGWDYELYMRDKGISAKLYIGGLSCVTPVRDGYNWRRPFELHRRALRERIKAESFDTIAVMNAMLLGDQGKIEPELRESMSRAGSAHLLAVSGLHIGFVAAVVYFTIRYILFYIFYFTKYEWASAGIPMKIAAMVAIIAVVWFGSITGPRLPSLRAEIMVSVYLSAVVMGRGRDFYGAFTVAMFIVLLFMPWSHLRRRVSIKFYGGLFHSDFPRENNKSKRTDRRPGEDFPPVVEKAGGHNANGLSIRRRIAIRIYGRRPHRRVSLQYCSCIRHTAEHDCRAVRLVVRPGRAV